MSQLLDQFGRPILSAPTSARGGELLREIAGMADGRDVTRPYARDLLDWEDDLLRSREASLSTYKRLLSDDQVFATLQRRRVGLVSREWRVEPGGTKREDKKAADWLREQLTGLGGGGWDKAVSKAHYGVFYGYHVAELMYARDGQHVALEAIRVRNRQRFRFGSAGELRMLLPTDLMRGEEMPPAKFWTYSGGGDHDDDPYGTGLAHWVYWPVWFKRNGLAAWLKLLDRWAAPVPHGTYPPGTPQHEQAKLLYTLHALRTDSAIVTPDGMSINMLESARAGQAGHGDVYDRMDRAISKVILSQTMTTDAQASGLGSSQADVHAEVAEEVIKGDADVICGSFNAGPVRWLTAWNFPNATPPSVWYNFEEAEDMAALAERDQKVFATGYRRTQQAMDEAYGKDVYERIAPAGSPPNTLAAPSEATFAEAGSADVSKAWREPVAARADIVVEGWIDQARTLLTESQSLAEFSERLAALYPDLDPSALADELGPALAAAHLAGRFDVTRGR